MEMLEYPGSIHYCIPGRPYPRARGAGGAGGGGGYPIRDFPNHATFREKGAKLACADKLGVFLSLTLCNKANFNPLQRVKYYGLEKM